MNPGNESDAEKRRTTGPGPEPSKPQGQKKAAGQKKVVKKKAAGRRPDAEADPVKKKPVRKQPHRAEQRISPQKKKVREYSVGQEAPVKPSGHQEQPSHQPGKLPSKIKSQLKESVNSEDLAATELESKLPLFCTIVFFCIVAGIVQELINLFLFGLPDLEHILSLQKWNLMQQTLVVKYIVLFPTSLVGIVAFVALLSKQRLGFVLSVIYAVGHGFVLLLLIIIALTISESGLSREKTLSLTVDVYVDLLFGIILFILLIFALVIFIKWSDKVSSLRQQANDAATESLAQKEQELPEGF